MNYLIWYWLLIAVIGLAAGIVLSVLYWRLLAYMALLKQVNPEMVGLRTRTYTAQGMLRVAITRALVHAFYLGVGAAAVLDPPYAVTLIAYGLTFAATLQLGLTVGDLVDYYLISRMKD